MLENIKSIYTSKNIFSFISEEKKLNLMKYNKLLQQKYEIDIYNYKIFSGKYIREEINGISKIYNAYTDTLIFEGEYLKGEKMEKGKNIMKKVNYYMKGNI